MIISIPIDNMARDKRIYPAILAPFLELFTDKITTPNESTEIIKRIGRDTLREKVAFGIARSNAKSIKAIIPIISRVFRIFLTYIAIVVISAKVVTEIIGNKDQPALWFTSISTVKQILATKIEKNHVVILYMLNLSLRLRSILFNGTSILWLNGL